jgi:hypothetical protein
MPPDTVRELRNDIAEVKAELRALSAALSERCVGHGRTIEDHNHALYGNGSPGVKTRVDRLEGKMSILWAAVGTGAAALIGLVIDAAWRALRH